MFKLVAVGGKLRGQEYILNEGENTLGRGHECDHVIAVDGISKKHISISVNNNNCFIEDLGSSNGTFVNGKLISKKTILDKDKIALPNIILQLVHVKEKKIIVKKKVIKGLDGEVDLDLAESAPRDALGRFKFFFKNTFMKFIYSFNEQYEWNFLLPVFLMLFMCGNLYIAIGPILFKSESIIRSEISERGKQIADEIVRSNSIHLSRGELQKIDTDFLERLADSGDVASYELTDIDGRIVRPASKIDSLDTDVFTAKSLMLFKKTQRFDKTYVDSSFDNEIGVSKILTINDIQTGQNKPVGLVAIRFKPDSLRQFKQITSSAYLTSFVFATILGALFFGIIYYLTLRPIQDLKAQSDEVLKGKKKEIVPKYLFEELHPLKNALNNLLQKNRENMNEDVGDFAEIEEDGPYVNILYGIMQGLGPAMILNSEKNIEFINESGGDLTGMRENLVQGSNILDSGKDDGFAGTILKLCDDSANSNGSNQSDFYELEGDEYIINVSGLIGKDNFAKAFLITFLKDK